MDIFGQLGINTTAAYQFVFFAITLVFLSKYVFAPYAHAFEERQRRTKGGQDLATEYHNKTVELHSEFEKKAREINGDIKGIVDEARTQSNKEYETIVSKAREEAEKLIKENRSKITSAIDGASQELKAQVPTIAMTITTKLIK